MLTFSFLLIALNSLDKIVLELTYPFLMGSSEGKAIIFFFLMGSMLLLSQFFMNAKYIKNTKLTSKQGNYYLKILIILISLTYVLGLIFEIWIRLKFGISIFTTFVSTSPTVGTSSIIHSHVFKSMLGVLISDIGIYIPSNIHTGISIAQYVPKFALIIFAVFPTVYVLGLFSLKDRIDIQKIILIFAISTTLIGMLDGGLFSAPALVGLSGLLGIYSIKKPFSLRNLIKPSSIIVILLIIRILIGLLGSNPEVYEITVLGEHGDIELYGFDVINEKVVDGKTIITVSSKMNELVVLNQIFNLLNGKYPVFFVSWNIYSFF
jgi:hypothetical protein